MTSDTTDAAYRWRNSAELGATAVIGALASLAITGFVFGKSNNLFHLPIVAALFDEPQYADDGFIQSLRFYASGIWLMLRGADRYGDPYWLFLALNYLSRLIAFVGFLLCANQLGVRTRRQRALFAGLLCLSSLLRVESYAGGSGLFLDYFTHSEVANGLTLITLCFAMRGRLTAAFATNGVVFFVNAFVAVWNAVPLGLIALFLLFSRHITWPRLLFHSSLGLLIFCLISAPIVNNILSNPDFGAQLNFDYLSFIGQYWPFHFEFDAIPWRSRIALISVVLLAAPALVALGRPARPLYLAFWGYAAVYGIGILAPQFTHSPTVLNLHLLRVSGMFHLLAVLASLALATRWFTGGDARQATVFAPILTVLLCTHRFLAVLAPLVVALGALPFIARRVPLWLTTTRFRLDHATALALLATWPFIIRATVEENHGATAEIAEWTMLGEWARANTPAEAVFLVATQRPRELLGVSGAVSSAQRLFQTARDVVTAEPAPIPEVPLQDDDPGMFVSTTTFEYESHRRVWADFKRGAAVMWTPTYYDVWWSRVSAVLALRSHHDRMAYARDNGIGYVIEPCSAGTGLSPLIRTPRLCLYAATPP